ncbi:MAG: hypothetical protein HWE26_07445 [Alteromonadaceae bacterium]|nr:hypothetical protein [Alteromonadaceae bacterium]
MKTLIAFCRKTGRVLSRFVNRLARALTRKGQLRISLALNIPFIAKFEIGYHVQIEKKEDKAA